MMTDVLGLRGEVAFADSPRDDSVGFRVRRLVGSTPCTRKRNQERGFPRRNRAGSQAGRPDRFIHDGLLQVSKALSSNKNNPARIPTFQKSRQFLEVRHEFPA
ncbi:MAG: hypothetical protein ACPG4K_00850 [Haloferula sp.]